MYKANITIGALMLPESRIIAELLLDNVNDEDWNHAIEVENVLQKRSSGSAARVASLIRARLTLMDEGLWDMVVNSSVRTAHQALMAAALKHSQLLADFMTIVLRDLYQRLEHEIPNGAWDRFLEGCASRDPEMPQWSDVTRQKLRHAAFQMLSEAGYLSDTRTKTLEHVDIAPELREYLTQKNELRILNCLEVSQ